MAVGNKILWTFLIGLIAGMAPFLFMQLLPALLMPTQQLVVANYLAILLTGLLVGTLPWTNSANGRLSRSREIGKWQR